MADKDEAATETAASHPLKVHHLRPAPGAHTRKTRAWLRSMRPRW